MRQSGRLGVLGWPSRDTFVRPSWLALDSEISKRSYHSLRRRSASRTTRPCRTVRYWAIAAVRLGGGHLVQLDRLEHCCTHHVVSTIADFHGVMLLDHVDARVVLLGNHGDGNVP